MPLVWQGLMLDARGEQGLAAERLRCVAAVLLCVLLVNYGKGNLGHERQLSSWGIDPRCQVFCFLLSLSAHTQARPVL